MELTTIIPMAGYGTRMAGAYSEPKPFVKLGDLTLLEIAFLGLPESERVIFVTRDELAAKTASLLVNSKVFNDVNYQVVNLPEGTPGQAATVLLGLKDVAMDAPILISNCDTYFSGDFEVQEGYDGMLGTFDSSSPYYSYVKLEDGVAVETAEKRVISDRASAGLYYFASKQLYVDAYEKIKDLPGEQYIAPMYNSMIADGLSVGESRLETVIPLGTPEEIDYAVNDLGILEILKSRAAS